MKLSKYILPVFVLVVLIQLAVPFKMIRDKEQVFKKGKAFKFKTAPIDPNDPFRGKYIYLDFDNSLTLYTVNDTTFQYLKEAYVVFDTDAGGYAHIKTVSKTRPKNTNDYLKVLINYYQYGRQEPQINIEYPFHKFYMDEYKAPQAEREYRHANQNLQSDCYAQVHIYQGQAALKDVFIDGQSVNELGNL